MPKTEWTLHTPQTLAVASETRAVNFFAEKQNSHHFDPKSGTSCFGREAGPRVRKGRRAPLRRTSRTSHHERLRRGMPDRRIFAGARSPALSQPPRRRLPSLPSPLPIYKKTG